MHDKLFKKLHQDRIESAKTFLKPSMKGFNRILKDMYADKAHFVFELIQNADDAEAKNIRFILENDHLIFTHDGKIKFTVSDPNKEEADSENGKLGHINSICSVGNTTKSEQKIGKFGIGFKSIFQYTDSPAIVDDNFSFEIKNLFVPYETVILSNDRKQGETLFFIPFNKINNEENDAFEDVYKKFETFPEQVLLFLNSIKNIRLSYANQEKKIIVKKIKSLTSTFSKDKYIESNIIRLNGNKVLLFSTLIPELNSDNQHKISIVFHLNEEDQIYSETKHNAYCFFPTSENTQLKFLIHAPFLLTDNRQNIKKENKWNEYLINKLSELVSNSLFVLRDNGFLTEDFFVNLPLDESDFKTNYYTKGFFYPIFSKIVETFKTNQLLPTSTGYYSSAEKSYLVRGRELMSLLPSRILSDLVKEKNVKIVFPSITETTHSDLINYCRYHLDIELIRPDDFIRKLSLKFIESREDKWLIKFYKYCNTRKALWNDLKNKPIIRLSDNSISAPYKEKTPIVFLEEVDENFPSIKNSLLENKDSYDFFTNLGLGKPDKKDLIFRIIVHRYKNERVEVDNDILINDLKTLVSYYFESSSSNGQELVTMLREVSFLVGIEISTNDTFLYSPSQLYLPDNELKLYFSNYEEYVVFDKNFYKIVIKEIGFEKTRNFLLDCGLSEQPRIIKEKKDYCHPEFKGKHTSFDYFEYVLEGFDSFVESIDFEKSLLLWNYLSRNKQLDEFTEIEFRYRYYTWYYKYYKSEFYKKIRSTKWLYDNEMKTVSSDEIHLSDLHSSYNQSHASLLISLLDFIEERNLNLSSEEQKELELGKKLRDAGITEFEIDEIIEGRNRKQLHKYDLAETKLHLPKHSKSKVTIEESFERQKKRRENESQSEIDSLAPKPELPGEKIKKIKDELEEKETEILRLEELKLIAQESKKYSFKWFKALLELEYFNRKDDEIKRNPIRIKFFNIEKEKNAKRTLILKTTEYIPITIEDNGELQLTLNYSNSDSKNILVEAVSRQNKILKAKTKENIDLERLNLSELQNAVIEIRNANFIFDSLKSSFYRFENDPFSLDENYNFQDNLPVNLQFIYGPPGTGKTTRLAQEILNIVENSDEFKILVLCPTNKAADVLTSKILDVVSNIPEYLIRFGITNDKNIENTVYINSRNLNSVHLHKLILITTVARFPYDFFNIIQNDKNYTYSLKEFDWDHVVFDEASMTNLPSIILPIYHRFFKNEDTSFIIAGDPFQIGPIIQTDVEGWKDGNIYSLVNLDHKDSFVFPNTIPHNFNIENLTTQYRSIPVVGKLFGDFTYNGILKHFRAKEDITQVNVEGFNLQPITLINFNVNPFESIFRPHRLKGSPYQIYSAILVVEFALYMMNNISFDKSDLSIGIICPYRAQQNIIDKILSTFPIPKNLYIATGTIHSFQGDECDIVLCIFNPPNNITNSERIFLNKQNILNVAISRAKDYLVIFSPFDPMQRIATNNLFRLQKIQHIIKNDSELSENFIEYTSEEIEQIIFGSKNIIVDSCFSTSHQEVNVYSKLDKKYEIRYDENAVDIQIKKV